MDKIRREANKIPILAKIEEITNNKVKKEHAMIALILSFLLIAMTTPIGAVVSSVFGVIIPLKETLVVLKQIKKRDDEVKHIIVFWVLFSALIAIDAYCGWIVRVIPFYYAFKFVFLFWIGPLRFRGGEFMYESFISKIPEKYYSFESASEILNSAAKKVSEVSKNSDFSKKDISNMAEEFMKDK